MAWPNGSALVHAARGAPGGGGGGGSPIKVPVSTLSRALFSLGYLLLHASALDLIRSAPTLILMLSAANLRIELSCVRHGGLTKECLPCSQDAWTDFNLSLGCMQGGSKVEEAACIFQELGDKFNWTVSPCAGNPS